MPVEVQLRPEDMPGRPISRIMCDGCGEHVQDGREVLCDGAMLCKACAGIGYYTRCTSVFRGERYAEKS